MWDLLYCCQHDRCVDVVELVANKQANREVFHGSPADLTTTSLALCFAQNRERKRASQRLQFAISSTGIQSAMDFQRGVRRSFAQRSFGVMTPSELIRDISELFTTKLMGDLAIETVWCARGKHAVFESYFDSLTQLVEFGSLDDILIWTGGRLVKVVEVSSGFNFSPAPLSELHGTNMIVCVGGYRSFLELTAVSARKDGRGALGCVVSPTKQNAYTQFELADGSGERLTSLRRAAKSFSALETWALWAVGVGICVSYFLRSDLVEPLSGILALLFASNMQDESLCFGALLTASLNDIDARQVWILANFSTSLDVQHAVWSALLVLPSLFRGEASSLTAVVVGMATAGALQLARGAREAAYTRPPPASVLTGMANGATLEYAIAVTRSGPLGTGRYASYKQLNNTNRIVACLIRLFIFPFVRVFNRLLGLASVLSAFPVWVAVLLASVLLKGRHRRFKWPIGCKPEWGKDAYEGRGCHWGKGFYSPTAMVLMVHSVYMGGDAKAGDTKELVRRSSVTLEGTPTRTGHGQALLGDWRMLCTAGVQHIKEERLVCIGGMLIPQHISGEALTGRPFEFEFSMAGTEGLPSPPTSDAKFEEHMSHFVSSR